MAAQVAFQVEMAEMRLSFFGSIPKCQERARLAFSSALLLGLFPSVKRVMKDVKGKQAKEDAIVIVSSCTTLMQNHCLFQGILNRRILTEV